MTGLPLSLVGIRAGAHTRLAPSVAGVLLVLTSLSVLRYLGCSSTTGGVFDLSPAGLATFPNPSLAIRRVPPTISRMTAYVSAKAGGRRLPPVRLGWGDLVVGIGLGFLLWLSVAAGQSRLETAASLVLTGARTSAPSRHVRGARLSPAEERQVRRVLEEARESRRAAVAFYEALHETDGPHATPATRVHAAELQALVDGVVSAGLERALGPERARSVYGASGPTSLTVSGP